MNAKEKVEKLLDLIERGATVIFSTYTRGYKIDKKTVSRFSAAGIPVLKATEKSIFMASGKKYLCMDFCAIRIQQ